MKDITAVLINYSDQSSLFRAIKTLKIISSRLKAILVIHYKSISQPLALGWEELSVPRPEHHTYEKELTEAGLNVVLSKINSEYILLLCQNDYLDPNTDAASFDIEPTKSVLTHTFHIKNRTLYHPLLIRTSLVNNKPFLLSDQLPFNEAGFPAWLSTIDDNLKVYRNNLVKRRVQNITPDWVEKQKFAEKYQRNQTAQQPSLAILITNYNMEAYINTAIASCLLQNEQAEQICIIDDGSTDNSWKKIKHWKHKTNIEIFRKHNEGKAKALNDLLAHVKADFILELDADDWIDPDAVSTIKKHLENLSADIAVLYGNLRKWKQLKDNVIYKNTAKGRMIKNRSELLAYHFPLGPRVYRATALQAIGGFPVTNFKDGRLFEDVSALNQLISNYSFQYENFTVYNVREHKESITSQNAGRWNDFLKTL